MGAEKKTDNMNCRHIALALAALVLGASATRGYCANEHGQKLSGGRTQFCCNECARYGPSSCTCNKKQEGTWERRTTDQGVSYVNTKRRTPNLGPRWLWQQRS